MQNYSNQTYKYAGKTYTFSASLYVNNNDGTKTEIYCKNEDIIMFQYENALNDLYIKGELIYIDKYGEIDKFIDKQFVYCQISNIEHEQKRDGNVTIENLSNIRKFQHIFFVSNIEIRNRQGHEITYCIQLVSANWINCVSSVEYTNYQLAAVDIIDIIKTILTTADLQIHKTTFDAIKSNVSINYLTHVNDNVLTSIKYLLNKMYYYQQKSDSLKFIIYNETEHNYQLFDLNNPKMNNGTTNIVISMFKTRSEGQFQQELINIGSITKMPKTKSFQSIFQQDVFDYNYTTNKFENKLIRLDSIVNFKNQNAAATNYNTKYKCFSSILKYNKSQSYWNNNLNIYDESCKALNEDNALVVTVDGDILRKPASYVIVNVDRDAVNIAGTESPTKLEKQKDKYKGLEGPWIVGKARHIIQPNIGRYKQNLVVFRNFSL